ncbi:hypothetical protein SAMN04488505_102713 [Chitinophaga rupis]|uniref:Uncharacterized protein n=1 Tax=Chitinophaga rupis TaxID=573321 RepID=A0A1H7RRJ3_9BACT|nr:hypothetical protein [Chitinophaga rupis]SEL62851.1 hypothetical protein SAMN04488505_102713 [Chitinophaga rupis]
MNGFLSRTNQYYKETFKDEPLAVEEIINHNNHLKLENQVKYLKSQPGISFQILKYNFLEYLVGNGYHGEASFFPSALLFILLFTILYNIWFVRDVQAYILKINEKSGHNEPAVISKEKKTALDAAVTFAQCFWMSVIVFLNPRFPAAYFRFRNSFMIVVVIEWLIGLVMIILFLIFIASKYAFVKTLLGI